MAGLQSDVAIDAGTSEMLQGRTSLWDRKSGKLLLVGWLFAAAVAWCFLRSHYDNWGKDGVGDTAVPVGLRAVVALALLAPVTLLIGKDSRLAWLTGLSVSLGTLPSLPLFPFLRDYTHLVILVWLLASWRSLWLRISLQRMPLFVFIFIGYTAVCAISAVVNFAIFHNTWQIKVGAAYLILFGAFAAMLYVLAAEPDKAEARLDNLLDGFIWGGGGQVVIALVAVPLIFVFPYS
ncbi:MAG: hypothetical protein QM576_07110 [Rhodopseudomonas sp.]|uniref:hypothetical protein n=1 Tax=Rhodopseudomonas sp. TaxID=1078 RepID=UPI0039E237F1